MSTPIEDQEREMQGELHTDEARIDYYWNQILSAGYDQNLKRVRECYYALKALYKGTNKPT